MDLDLVLYIKLSLANKLISSCKISIILIYGFSLVLKKI